MSYTFNIYFTLLTTLQYGQNDIEITGVDYWINLIFKIQLKPSLGFDSNRRVNYLMISKERNKLVIM